jgi:hypothetical protein
VKVYGNNLKNELTVSYKTGRDPSDEGFKECFVSHAFNRFIKGHFFYNYIFAKTPEVRPALTARSGTRRYSCRRRS